MKKIYIILTHTGTLPSKIIKLYTGAEFSHISIALDPNLDLMYSFGRRKLYNPLYAGFVHESISNGLYNRFKNTKTCIYSLEIEDYKYNIIKSIIKVMEDKSEEYKYNMLGLIAVSFHIRISRKKSFYCAEFIKYLFEKSHIISCDELPKIVKPEDFKKIDNLKKEYKGNLRKYYFMNKNKLLVS